jgi:hypothetical protein
VLGRFPPNMRAHVEKRTAPADQTLIMAAVADNITIHHIKQHFAARPH